MTLVHSQTSGKLIHFLSFSFGDACVLQQTWRALADEEIKRAFYHRHPMEGLYRINQPTHKVVFCMAKQMSNSDLDGIASIFPTNNVSVSNKLRAHV